MCERYNVFSLCLKIVEKSVVSVGSPLPLRSAKIQKLKSLETMTTTQGKRNASTRPGPPQLKKSGRLWVSKREEKSPKKADIIKQRARYITIPWSTKSQKSVAPWTLLILLRSFLVVVFGRRTSSFWITNQHNTIVPFYVSKESQSIGCTSYLAPTYEWSVQN